MTWVSRALGGEFLAISYMTLDKVNIGHIHFLLCKVGMVTAHGFFQTFGCYIQYKIGNSFRLRIHEHMCNIHASPRCDAL